MGESPKRVTSERSTADIRSDITQPMWGNGIPPLYEMDLLGGVSWRNNPQVKHYESHMIRYYGISRSLALIKLNL